MIGSEKGVSLNIGGGGHTDATALALAAMNNNNRDGGLSGNGLWAILLLALLGHGRGLGVAGGAAAVAATDAPFFQLMNQLCSISKEISASASVTQAAVESNGDRVISNNNLQTQLMDSNFTQTRASISESRAASDANFSGLKESITSQFVVTNNSINTGFVSLAKEIACAFTTLNTNLANQFNGLNNNLCQSFGKVYQQNGALACAIEKLSGKVDSEAAKTDALIVSSTKEILNAQVLAQKDALIAELSSEHSPRNLSVAVNNINNNIVSLLSRISAIEIKKT